MIRSRIPLLAAAVIALSVASPAFARADDTVAPQDSPFGRWRQDEARQETREGTRISSSEALSRVRQRAGRGHHMRVDETRQGNRVIYVITWDYENGRIGRFTVDGQTGQVSGG